MCFLFKCRNHAPTLDLGLIRCDPVNYYNTDRHDYKRWMFDTWLGYIYKDSEPSYTVCKEWKENMCIQPFKAGDVASVLLEEDRTFSVAKNGAWVRGIFTDLPDGDLWLVVFSRLTKISISEKGT